MQVSGKEFLAIVLLGLAGFVCSLILQYLSAPTILQVDLQSDQEGVFQLYWDDFWKEYTEQHSSIAELTTLPMHLSIDLPPLWQIKHLRIDPNTTDSLTELTTIRLLFPDGKRLDLLPYIKNSKQLAQHQLRFQASPQDNHLLVQSMGLDPHFEFSLPLTSYFHLQWKQSCIILLCFILLMLFVVNQHAIKGSKKMGTLHISIQDPPSPALHTAIMELGENSLKKWRQKRKQYMEYTIILDEMDPHLVAELLFTIKEISSSAKVSFQYNRPCEV